MARDTEDSSKESSTYYVEGKLYYFIIEEVIKGNSESDIIEVNQRFSDNYSGKTTYDGYFVEVDYSQEYILFLNYNEMFGHYYGCFDPFIFSINNDIVFPCANGKEIENIIGEINLESIRNLAE